jgi:hypothetical protein
MESTGLRYLCLSDLHLGAKYSVLTRLREAKGVSSEEIRIEQVEDWKSETLKAFSGSLRSFLAALSRPGQRPRLVLLGDVLDLSFSDWFHVTEAFLGFIDELFPRDPGSRLFDDEILLIPGNHDHHLWRRIKDCHYSQQVEAGLNPIEPLEITGLFDRPVLESELLSAMIHNLPGRESLRVVSAYPNFAVANEARSVVMHHGHFVESTYTLMTSASDWVFETATERTAENLERQNGPWIDFGWSSLGAAGMASAAEKQYLMSQDEAAQHGFIKRLGKRMSRYLGALGSGDLSAAAPGITLTGAITAALDYGVGKVSDTERSSYMYALTPDAVRGLKDYLTGPVHGQLVNKDPSLTHRPVSFIFGHTHKPFQDQLIARGFRHPVGVYNSGGWVLDAPKMMRQQGAALVFVDEALHVASLRLFNDPLDNDPPPVYAAGVGGYSDGENPLLSLLQRNLDPEHWQDFTRAFTAAAERRAVIAARYSFDPEQNPAIGRNAMGESA